MTTYELTHDETAALVRTAKALLLRIENITTEQFSRGAEREERKALHDLLFRIGALDHDHDGYKR